MFSSYKAESMDEIKQNTAEKNTKALGETRRKNDDKIKY